MTIPPVRSEHESDPPNSHHDSSRPAKWELDKALAVVRENLAENEALKESLAEISENLKKERKRRDDLEEELEEFRKKSKRDDEQRDADIAFTKKGLTELADKVAKIAAPQLEASGAVGAKAVTDQSSKSTKRWAAVASFVGVTIATAISTGFAQCNHTKPDPGVTVPNTQPRPAGSGPFGMP